MKKLNQVKEILQSHGLRITQSRLAVATILIKNSERPLTPEEIFNKVQNSKSLNCDQVSVYRTLTTFEELGLVKKSVFQGEAARYMLNESDRTQSHHHEHFFKCDSCDVIEPFEDCLVSKKEKELERSGYKNLHHHLEITGLCPSCAQL